MPDLPDAKVHAHPHARRPGESRGPGRRGLARCGRRRPGYAELVVTTNFTFLQGAGHPDEYVQQAARLGYHAAAITDHNTLAGIVRAHVAAKEAGMPLVVGCRLVFAEPAGLSLLVYPTDRASYGRLCTLLTIGKRRAAKGECHLTLNDLLQYQQGLLGVLLPTAPDPNGYAQESRRLGAPEGVPNSGGTAPLPHGRGSDLRASVPEPALYAKRQGCLRALFEAFDDDRLSVGVSRLYGSQDETRLMESEALAGKLGVPIVAVNDVYYPVADRQPLQDVLTGVRHGCTIAEAGFRLFPNGERYLKPVEDIARLWRDRPKALARTIEIADRASSFSLDRLRYEYAEETCPPGKTPMEHLKSLTWKGAKERYPKGIPNKVRRQIEHEFALIEELNYAPYFLTVHDLVRFARSRGILCQGRGAVANSAVCYCLGVTAVDPDRIDVLFERFVSRERNEPPDIDIDFEHERREEVIQYIYQKYGRDRAGLTAEVITYRRRSAIRDVGKALGFSLDAVDRIAKRVDRWEKNPFADSESGDVPAQLAALGFDPVDETVRLFVQLVRELLGFPRHLSQHVGGFVITRGPLCELVPIENAAMPDRTVIEWDKDDIDALGILKVDVLGLGMLTAIRRGLALIEQHHGRPLSLASIPAEDPAVYDMLCRADTLGVFQVESRAQMTMLPRLKPRCFYDLVIEVAIVRPGPIVGDMVHPYLRRRNGEEPVVYPDETIRRVLGKTLGVPLFQEQVMALAIEAAGFTPGEAEKLRRAITAWTSRGDIAEFPARFVGGMVRNGYRREFAEWCFERFKGFSQYGFPESHAASFALLVYASAWIKCYYPAVFAAALLNSQPMGFYAPAQIVRDAIEHGVEVRPVDVNHSTWDCTLEEGTKAQRHEGTKAASRVASARAEVPDNKGTKAPLTLRVKGKLRHEGTKNPSRDRLPFTSRSDVKGEGADNKNPRDTRALRLGLRMVSGLKRRDADAIVEAVRRFGPFASIFDLWRAGEVSAASLRVLAQADAFRSMGLDRQRALWEVQAIHGKPLPLFDGLPERRDSQVKLPVIPLADDVTRDYCSVGLSLKAHPVSFLRPMLMTRRIITAAEAKDEKRSPFGRFVSVAGIVLFRQRPGTARGVMFMTIEDETARLDLIVRPEVYERFREAAVYAKLVIARGRVERRDRVVHVLVHSMEDVERLSQHLPHLSRDFR